MSAGHGQPLGSPEDPGEQVAGSHLGAGEHDPLLDELRSGWERSDPVPAGLADRVLFALQVEALGAADGDLDLEFMRLVQEEPVMAGSRGDEVRTITFGSESMTVMLALTDVDGGYRVDGWVAPAGRRRIEVRTARGSHEVQSDDTGRFTVPLAPPGHFQLVLDGGVRDAGEATPEATGAPGAAGAGGGRRAVVTPALTL